MISKFGLVMRDIRNRYSESLRTCAERLNITAAFLSAMEVGRKSIPSTYCDKITKLYDLDEKTHIELYNAIIETNQHVDIEISKMNEAQKEVSMAFARRIENADPELLEKLRKALVDDQE